MRGKKAKHLKENQRLTDTVDVPWITKTIKHLSRPSQMEL